ncbi:MAG TPA: 4Fe-4S binding protein [Phycisphaerales bacterium]|nr:4Fe-4S binding protein [Phycisphaerales bacterium]
MHVAIAAHIVYWRWAGSTVSPVEPSESMYTLETGAINAGFVFFALAILSTLLLGRWFCGWACHVVALQDLCSWMMRRLGVHPKPFRSRVLVFAPLVLALYMFAWPTFKRLALRPALEAAGIGWHRVRVYLGEVPSWPGWSTEFIKEDFWGTFPPWYVAIPFLAICGFAVVYFLGSKGFCTYGCPYGGFFAPVDKLAPVRIRVTDACEGCGHCTAVCTSNVRVHQEVRDFGMVVDPGCMKCLDCVTVCPKDALYVGLGRPAVLAKPRARAASPVPGPVAPAGTRPARRVYDLTWPEEFALALVFLALVLAFRGMLNQVPLLMAMGLASIGTFGAWKLWRLARDPSVRVQSLQLKFKGRWRPTGAVFAAGAVLLLASAAWSGTVRATLWRAGLVDELVTVPMQATLAPGYTPDPGQAAAARRAIALYRRGGPVSDGGWGWQLRPALDVRLAYLSAVARDLAAAEHHLLRAIRNGTPEDQWVLGLAEIMAARRTAPEQIEARLLELLEATPGLVGVRFVVAQRLAETGRLDQAVALYDRALAHETLAGSARTHMHAAIFVSASGNNVRALELAARAAELALAADHRDYAVIRDAARALAQLGKPQEGRAMLARAAETVQPPHRAAVLHDLAALHAVNGDLDAALDAMIRAQADAPDDPALAMRRAELHQAKGDHAGSERWLKRARELAEAPGAGPSPPAPGH